jgi:hypothetical protein
VSLDPVSAIAEAIKEGAVLFGQIMKDKPRARREAAIEAAENFIRVHERSGEYADIPDKKREALLVHFSKRFWKYN